MCGWWSFSLRAFLRAVMISSWCGHCKAMKDEWIKAAGAMTGIVHFGMYSYSHSYSQVLWTVLWSRVWLLVTRFRVFLPSRFSIP